jgi:hypothetical protein
MEIEAKEKACADREQACADRTKLVGSDEAWSGDEVGAMKRAAGKVQLQLEERLLSTMEVMATRTAKTKAAQLKLEQQWHAHEKVKSHHR